MSECCECCGERLTFTWTDTHGIGACIRCGMPYRIIHRDDSGKILDEPPEPALTSEGVDIAKRYWAETKGRVFPAIYDMGFDRGYSYSGATPADCQAFGTWYKANVTDAALSRAEPSEVKL